MRRIARNRGFDRGYPPSVIGGEFAVPVLANDAARIVRRSTEIRKEASGAANFHAR